MDDIEDMVEGLSSQADFISFLDALKIDARQNSATWENDMLADFLMRCRHGLRMLTVITRILVLR
jgi:hypothetical protein